MDLVIEFFKHPFFILLGGVSTLIVFISFLYTFFLILKGVLPVWYRLGIGLSKGRIAIFSISEYNSLKNMMVDSKIFLEKNIMQINKNEIKKAEKESIFLVHWKDFKDQIDEIIAIKKDSMAMIVYAPQNEGKIEPEVMELINQHRNSIVVNLRGRLLNDILTSLITTSYEKR